MADDGCGLERGINVFSSPWPSLPPFSRIYPYHSMLSTMKKHHAVRGALAAFALGVVVGAAPAKAQLSPAELAGEAPGAGARYDYSAADSVATWSRLDRCDDEPEPRTETLPLRENGGGRPCLTTTGS